MTGVACPFDLLDYAPMRIEDLDEVVALEQSVFPHPWSRTNFSDSLSSGYDAWVLREPNIAGVGETACTGDAANEADAGVVMQTASVVQDAKAAPGALAGYFLLMAAVDEAHLLDVAVATSRQGSGLGRYLLDKVAARARGLGVESVLLEVRPSNLRALDVYRRYGYREIGRRRAYYPAHQGQREDAIVMRYVL